MTMRCQHRATNYTTAVQKAASCTVFDHSYKEAGSKQCLRSASRQLKKPLSKRQQARLSLNPNKLSLAAQPIVEAAPIQQPNVSADGPTGPKKRSETLARRLAALIAAGASAQKTADKARDLERAKYREARVADFGKKSMFKGSRGARNRALVAAC